MLEKSINVYWAIIFFGIQRSHYDIEDHQDKNHMENTSRVV